MKLFFRFSWSFSLSCFMKLLFELSLERIFQLLLELLLVLLVEVVFGAVDETFFLDIVGAFH